MGLFLSCCSKHTNKFQTLQTFFKNMQVFYDRLLKLIEYQGFKTLNDFAINGLNYDSSSKLARLKDPSKRPSLEILEDIANKFESVDLHWLITGKGEMLRNVGAETTPENYAGGKVEAPYLQALVDTQQKLIDQYERELVELRDRLNIGSGKHQAS